MRVLLYEWCCSGGLPAAEASIAREGRMMLEALAADAAKSAGLELDVLVDATRSVSLPSRARRLPVTPGDDAAALVAASHDADWTLIVAPESDGILLDRVRAVRAAGGRVLAPADGVVQLCSDKQATLDALAGRGIPVPAGRPLAGGEPMPRSFRLPAIRKARAGCGCEGLVVVGSHDHASASTPTRLEVLVPGTPVGVSLLCGPQGSVPLPVMRQRFTAGGGPRYEGSDPLDDAALAARATALARRSAGAVGAEAGWLGVDLILGPRADGRDDRVLEVNPRATTSIVGQSRLFASSLVAAMIDAADGGVPALEPTNDPSETGRFRLTGD